MAGDGVEGVSQTGRSFFFSLCWHCPHIETSISPVQHRFGVQRKLAGSGCCEAKCGLSGDKRLIGKYWTQESRLFL